MKNKKQKVDETEVPHNLANVLLHKRNIVDNITLITIFKITFNFVQHFNIY